MNASKDSTLQNTQPSTAWYNQGHLGQTGQIPPLPTFESSSVLASDIKEKLKAIQKKHNGNNSMIERESLSVFLEAALKAVDDCDLSSSFSAPPDIHEGTANTMVGDTRGGDADERSPVSSGLAQKEETVARDRISRNANCKGDL